MSDGSLKLTAGERRDLISAGIKEAGCVLAGVAAYFATSNWLWILIGVVAGAGFSLPAIIRLMRARKQADHASR